MKVDTLFYRKIINISDENGVGGTIRIVAEKEDIEDAKALYQKVQPPLSAAMDLIATEDISKIKEEMPASPLKPVKGRGVGLDSGLWTLDSELWTLESGRGLGLEDGTLDRTRDSGRGISTD
ncbi:UNVERIFIED_CONTAM: hypothetical protein FKN15_068208 [Acipenser sinensis]